MYVCRGSKIGTEDARFRLQNHTELRLHRGDHFAGHRQQFGAGGLAVIDQHQRVLFGNAGSFFKNPMLPEAAADALKAAHPELPVFPSGVDGYKKLSAAWLIEKAGWKGYRKGDAGIAEQHALVLVNHGKASGAELLTVARNVVAAVQTQFGVVLEPEPRILGADF